MTTNSSSRRWFSALTGRSNLTGAGLGALGAVALLLLAWAAVTTPPRAELRLKLSDGAVWLPSTVLGGVSLLDGGSGSIATSLGVATGHDRFDVVQWGSDAIIVNETDGTVSRLDGSAWTITTGRIQFGIPGQPLTVVAGDDVGWLVQDGTATLLDLDSLRPQLVLPVGAAFADGLVTSAGDLLYAGSDPDVPLRRFHIDGSDPETVGEVNGPVALADLGGTHAAVDLDDHSVWLDGRGTVCASLEYPATTRLQAGGADGRLMVVSAEGGVFLWDPTESGCPGNDDFIALGPGNYGRPVLTTGWAVVQDVASGQVIIIDFDDARNPRHRTLEGVDPGTPVQLVAENGAVWYNDPLSAHAGLIHKDGTVIATTKYDAGTDAFVAAPLGDDLETEIAVAGTQTGNESDSAEQPPPADPTAGPPTTLPTGDPAPGDTGGPPPETPSDPNDEGPGPDGADPNDLDSSADPGAPGENDAGNDADSGPPTTDTIPPPEPEPGKVVEIRIGASAAEVVAGGNLTFRAITVRGNPNTWDLTVTPDSGRRGPFHTFGTFDYVFYDVGRYTVSITACDSDGNCDSPRIAVNVVANPDAVTLVAAFDAPSVATVGQSVTLLDASQGSPGSWSWDLDGGSPATSGVANPTVSWSTPGDKTVTLTVTRGSQTSEVTRVIRVNPPATEPAPFGLNCSPSTLNVGAVATCQLLGDPADFSAINWTVSPGSAVGGASGPGAYTVTSPTVGVVSVTLSATDIGTGHPVSATFSLTFVTSPAPTPPEGTLTGPGTVEAGTSNTYRASGTHITSWSWSGQGSPSFGNPSGEITSVRWDTPGTYLLRVVLGGSTPVTLERTITVTAPPPSITFNPTCGPSTRPANGSSAATCRLSDGNHTEFSALSWAVANPAGLELNRWGSPGEHYVASFDPGSVTVTVTATHIASGTAMSGGPWTITFEAVNTPSPFGLSCSPTTIVAESGEVAYCTLQGNPSHFSNLNYAITAANPSALNTWGGDVGWNIGYGQPGTVTVTLTGTDLATGNPVSATRTVTFVAPTPPSEPPPSEPPPSEPPPSEPPPTEPPPPEPPPVEPPEEEEP